jgi:hypothetical protein
MQELFIAFSWISSMVWKWRPFKVVLSLGNRKVCWGYVWRTGWMGHNGCLMFCQITADERCASQCIVVAQHPSLVSHNSGLFLRTASLKRAKISWYNCLPSDHVVQIHDGQCLSNQKVQPPPPPWSLTDSSVLFLVKKTLSPVLPVCLVKQLRCLCTIFTKFAAKSLSLSLSLSHARAPARPPARPRCPHACARVHTHTHTQFFKLFYCHFVTHPTNSLCMCSVQRMYLN